MARLPSQLKTEGFGIGKASSLSSVSSGNSKFRLAFRSTSLPTKATSSPIGAIGSVAAVAAAAAEEEAAAGGGEEGLELLDQEAATI